MIVCRSALSNLFSADMNKFGPSVVGTIFGGVITFGVTTYFSNDSEFKKLFQEDLNKLSQSVAKIDSRLENVEKSFEKLRKESKRTGMREHNAFMREVHNPMYLELDRKWKAKLKSIDKTSHSDPLSIFKYYNDGYKWWWYYDNDESSLKEAEKLLNYYLTYPCGDVVELNYDGEGYSVLGEDLESLKVVNQLLCYVVGRKSFDKSKAATTSIGGHLTNYMTFCSYLERNRNTVDVDNNLPPDYTEKVLQMHDLFYLCSNAIDCEDSRKYKICSRFKENRNFLQQFETDEHQSEM